MSYDKQKSAKREYFSACFLAIFTAVAGLVEPGARTSNGLILVGVLAVLIVVGSYFQMGRAAQEAGQEDIVPSESRLRRMAILWYVLSLVLAIGLVRGPLRWSVMGGGGSPSLAQWLLGVVGLIVCCVTGRRLYKIIKG